MYPDMEPLPCPTFEDAFNAVETGKADLAMIPIENTIAGRVADIHHLLPELRLHIIGEYFLPIHFHLMVLPGTQLEAIKVCPQPHPRSRPVPQDHPPPSVEVASSPAIPRVPRGWSPKRAIVPWLRWRRAWRPSSTGSNILAENVEDTENNITRFVVLSKEKAWAPRRDPQRRMMTTFIFRVRNIPAALYKAMGGFATNGVNMTKLESYQLGGKFFSTLFYSDIEGHPDDRHVALALEELTFFSREVRILGVYEAHRVPRLAERGRLSYWIMIPKSGCRFLEKIVLKQEARVRGRFEEASLLSRPRPSGG